MPKIGKREVVPKPVEQVVLVYPKDEKIIDSEEIKNKIKELMKPKQERFQIKAFCKVQWDGIVIEAGTIKTAENIKEVTKTEKMLKCVEPDRMNPKVLIYDVDREIEEEELLQCLFKQNLEDAGYTEKEVKDKC